MPLTPATKKLGTFKLHDIVLSIGGFRIEGGDDSTFVSYEVPDGPFTPQVDAYGGTHYSASNRFDVTATITCMQTSQAHATLWNLLLAQRDIVGPITPLPYIHLDPNNGTTIKSAYTVFVGMPSENLGREAQSVEYRVHLPNALENAKLGENLLIPALF